MRFLMGKHNLGYATESDMYSVYEIPNETYKCEFNTLDKGSISFTGVQQVSIICNNRIYALDTTIEGLTKTKELELSSITVFEADDYRSASWMAFGMLQLSY